MKNKTILATYITSTLSLFSTSAISSGFQSFDHSTTGLGRAYAGEAALADNAAAQFSNPAMLSYLPGAQVSTSLIYTNPNIDINGVTTNSTGQQIATSSKDIASSNTIPSLYISYQLDDMIFLGLAVSSNFANKYKLDDNFLGTQFGNEMAVTTLEFNPNISYQIDDRFSIGGGIRFVDAQGSLGSKSSGGSSAPAGTVLTHVQGEDFGIGWLLGGAWQIDKKNRLGVNYRSAVNLSLEGQSHGLAFGTTEIMASNMDLTLPSTLELSTYNIINEQISLHASVSWTNWSSLDKLEVKTSPATISNHLILDKYWMDSYRFSIGGTYKLDEKITLRTGLAYDQSVLNTSTRITSMPDSDSIWVGIGAGYKHSQNITIDAGLAYIYLENTDIINPRACFNSDLSASNFGGTFVGMSQGNIITFGLQASYRF